MIHRFHDLLQNITFHSCIVIKSHLYFTIGQFQKVMDPELEALRQARMQQLQGGGEQAAQKVKYSEILLFFK